MNLLANKKKAIQILIDNQILRFGELKTKSGRLSPYFVDMGKVVNTKILIELAEVYAEVLLSKGFQIDCIFGPAYKGIGLATSLSLALMKLGRGRGIGGQVDFAFNRKESKKHGEGGVLIGRKLTSRDKVVIVDDVITSGISIMESLQILKANGNPQVMGIIVAVDRLERSLHNRKLTASQFISQKIGIPVYSILDINDVLQEVDLSIEDRGRVVAYQKQYGISLK